MNKQLTPRETQLMLIVLAAALIRLHLWRFFRAAASHGTIRQCSPGNRSRTPESGPVKINRALARKAKVSLLGEQIKVEQRRAATHPASKLPARWTSPAGRLEALAVIGSACESHGLVVVTTSRQTDAANAMRAQSCCRSLPRPYRA